LVAELSFKVLTVEWKIKKHYSLAAGTRADKA
jgi:hypothetical protein